MKWIPVVTLVGVAACAPAQADDETPPIDPRAEPEVVAPGVISTDRNQTFPSVDPVTGALWFSEYEDSFDDQTILVSHSDEGVWSQPVVAPFSGTWGDRAPRFSPDGVALYFTSNRPMPGEAEPGDMNLWVTGRLSDGWSEPRPVPGINADGPDIHLSASSEGLWFASLRDGGFGRSDLYRLGSDGDVVHLGPELNDARSQPDLWISPDESWMIVVITDHPDGFGGDDLYLSRRSGDQWTAPRNLGPSINSDEYEYGPSLDPEGVYLYYTSHRDGASHVYRIEVDSVEGLR